MLTNEQLYGKGVRVPPIPESLANQRITLLNARLKELSQVHFMEQDVNTMTQIIKAISFWKQLREGEGI